MNHIQKGTTAFRKVNVSFFAGAFTTFAVLYSVQPILPELSKYFHITPMASLSLSTTTAFLAVSMLVAGSLSEAWGRKSLMTFSIFAGSVMTVIAAFVSSYYYLLGVRILLGIVLAGLPSIAMAYLGEEIEPSSLGMAMGLYISGNSFGGMIGRILSGMLTDLFNWRIALAGIGILGVIASIIFWASLPQSRNFHPRSLETGKLISSMINHLKDKGLLCLYGISFLLMGSFIMLYNYIGYQLTAPPYSLSQTLVGWLFIVYLAGTFSSAILGRMADKYGRHKVIWLGILIMLAGAVITLNSNLLVKIGGVAVLTFGFFGSHAIASGWVGYRAAQNKAQAASLYLFSYYVGSSFGGTLGGVFWTYWGWGGVVGIITVFLIAALILSVRLYNLLVIREKNDEALHRFSA